MIQKKPCSFRFSRKKLILLFLLIITLIHPTVFLYAQSECLTERLYTQIEGWPKMAELNAEGVYFIEINTGTVLYEQNAEMTFYPASITKILTALVVLEHCSLDEEVTFSYNAVHDLEEGAYSYIAATGDVLSVEDCLYAMLLQSSNEAAYALAEHCSGSMEEFAILMNEKAKEVGATNSHFSNSHGLYDENHYTTPHDMARIMWAAIQNETFLTIDSTVTYQTAATTMQPDGYVCQMRHYMMRSENSYYNSAVVAGKTGYIQAAKNTLVTYAQQGELEFICVVMCCDGADVACEDTQTLLDYGWNNFSLYSLADFVDLSVLEERSAEKITSLIQNITLGEEAIVLLPRDFSFSRIETTLQLDTDDVENDTINGVLSYYCDGNLLGEDSVTVRLVPTGINNKLLRYAQNLAQFWEERNLSGIVRLLLGIMMGGILLTLILTISNKIHRKKKKKKHKRRKR